MAQAIAKSSKRPSHSLPRFGTTFYTSTNFMNPAVVRIVHAFQASDDRNREAKPIIDDVLKTWPERLKTRYLITAAGFLSFQWPTGVFPADPARPSKNEIRLLGDAAVGECRKLLTPLLRKRLAKVADYVSIGADSKRDDDKSRTVELVLLFDLHSPRSWITGKSYPTGAQENRLVRLNDLSRHHLTVGRDKILLLVCHDLNMFSRRALKTCSTHGWRRKVIDEMREAAHDFAPTVVLQHPHYTHSPHSWSTALGGLNDLLPNVVFASAGRWCQPNKATRRPLQNCLRATARGAVATAVVRRMR
jgi:hypothetical protein